MPVGNNTDFYPTEYAQASADVFGFRVVNTRDSVNSAMYDGGSASADPTGKDVRTFKDQTWADTSEVPLHIIHFGNGVSPNLEWYNVIDLSSLAPVTYYHTCGDPAAVAYPPNDPNGQYAVWPDSNFLFVSHGELDGSDNLIDATSRGNHLSKSGPTSIAEVASAYGYGNMTDYGGGYSDDNYHSDDTPSSMPSSQSEGTFIATTEVEFGSSEGALKLLCSYGDTWHSENVSMFYFPTGQFGMFSNWGVPSSSKCHYLTNTHTWIIGDELIIAGSWNDGQKNKVYYQGVEEGTLRSGGFAATSNNDLSVDQTIYVAYIKGFTTTQQTWRGSMDTVLMFRTQLSDDAVKSYFDSLNDPSTFTTAGTPGTIGPAPEPTPEAPELVFSTERVLGTWRVDSIKSNSLKSTVSIKEPKQQLKATLPLRVFSRELYPDADVSIYGESIPIAYGSCAGRKAFQIDRLGRRFKLLDHAVDRFTSFRKNDGEPFVPDTIDLATAEFTYLAFEEGDELFASAEIDDSKNPVDAGKIVLTDTERGVGLDISQLDTTSTGRKGFGTNGARLRHIYGYTAKGGEEAVDFEIALYVDSDQSANEILQQLSLASFSTVYVNQAGLFTWKTWEPEPSEELPEITEDDIMLHSASLQSKAVEPKTAANIRYAFNEQLDSYGVFAYEDDDLLALRGLTIHNVLDRELPLAKRLGAQLWGQRSVAHRGVQRRILTLTTTAEFRTLEIGDMIRVRFPKLGVDGVWEILSTNFTVGKEEVKLTLIDVRGCRDKSGFWVEDNPSFPSDLGGAAITQWDDTWTDEQKQWARENIGWWSDDNGYLDTANDPFWSYYASVWI